jgi:carboxylesterase type B
MLFTTMPLSSIVATAFLYSQLALAVIIPQCSAPTANTLNGTYYGVHNSFYNEDFFLGIPYAQPPINSLRYRPAQPLNSSWSSPNNATQYGYECVGYGVSFSHSDERSESGFADSN